MFGRFTVASLALLIALAPTYAASTSIRGHYVEARTCSVWTGPCFANAEFNLTGKNAVMAWRVEQGNVAGVSLDGLGVVAVLSASNTLGLKQTGPTKAVLLIDKRASSEQREALIRMAKAQAGSLLNHVVAVQTTDISVDICPCKGDACAEVKAGKAYIKTRCINEQHDKACGNEIAFYPPLARGVKAKAAAAIEHGYKGNGLSETWREFERAGAYVGSFIIK